MTAPSNANYLPPRPLCCEGISLIANEGYAAFTLRAVAARNGIKLASLQYHYRTKEDLLRAIAKSVQAEYAERLLDRSAPRAAQNAEQLLDDFVGYVLEENQRPETSDRAAPGEREEA